MSTDCTGVFISIKVAVTLYPVYNDIPVNTGRWVMEELHKPGEDNQKPGKYVETGPQDSSISCWSMISAYLLKKTDTLFIIPDSSASHKYRQTLLARCRIKNRIDAYQLFNQSNCCVSACKRSSANAVRLVYRDYGNPFGLKATSLSLIESTTSHLYCGRFYHIINYGAEDQK
jgi:hypothetical protein